MKLLLGTSSSAKRARLYDLLAGLPLALVDPATLGTEPPIEEGADSLAENATRKATAWARAYGVATIATDGGLEIPSLPEWNTVLTRRAAGTSATDAQRAAHLLQLAAPLTGQQRRAERLEAAALADASGRLVGCWKARGKPAHLAQAYDSRGVPPGFWLPGMLEFGPLRKRYWQLTEAERRREDMHWEQLRAPLREAIQTLITADAP